MYTYHDVVKEFIESKSAVALSDDLFVIRSMQYIFGFSGIHHHYRNDSIAPAN